jgi:hypothetical protein
MVSASSGFSIALQVLVGIGSLAALVLTFWALWRLAPTMLGELYRLPNFRKRLAISITVNAAIGLTGLLAGIWLLFSSYRIAGFILLGVGIYWLLITLVLRQTVLRGFEQRQVQQGPSAPPR